MATLVSAALEIVNAGAASGAAVVETGELLTIFCANVVTGGEISDGSDLP